MITCYFVCLLVFPVALWFLSVGNVVDYFDDGVPDGQALYIFSKLAGLLAVSLLTLQISLMSFRRITALSTPTGVRLHWTGSHHALLGTLCVVFATLHFGLFFFATSARSNHWNWPLLVPRFQSGFYDAMVSIGTLAFYAIFLVGILGWVSRMRRQFRPIHQISVVICTLGVIIHSYAIGSETHLWAFRAYYILLILILLGSAGTMFREGRMRQSNA